MNEPTTTVRVWDLPTRVFHWLLAACVIASIATARAGGDAMAWHLRLGGLAITLIAFRVVWGVVGGHWSRFARFAYAPSALGRSWRGASRPDEHHEVGHTPLGALSVFVLLAALVLQTGTGLFADDEVANAGPIAEFVPEASRLALTRWRRGGGQWLLFALMGLHVGAILYHLVVKRRDLVTPMLTGDKRLAVPAPAAVDTLRSRLFALVLLVACAGVVRWAWSLGA